MSQPMRKLNPPRETAEDELCRCMPAPPRKLMPALGFNPVHCVQCNLEVRPEDMLLPDTLVEELARWNGVYQALDTLWLDSGEYESFARAELSDLASAINTRGLTLRRQISDYFPCYYWVWRDADAAPGTTTSSPACPLCSRTMIPRWTSVFDQRVCDGCCLVLAA
jgi:Zn-ribbon-containing, possibly nucleic-acid-binding protein (DUF2310)